MRLVCVRGALWHGAQLGARGPVAGAHQQAEYRLALRSIDAYGENPMASGSW